MAPDERNPPAVTVLMAVYNGEQYLQHAIDSLIRQSFRDFELVVVNDGSTDASAEILGSYRDERLRVIDNRTNLGLAASLNVGLRYARAPLVARLDADDVAEPDWLVHMVATMDRRPEVAFAATWFVETDPEGRPLEYGRPPSDPTMLRWRLLFHCPVVHSGVILRRSVLAEVGAYDESFGYGEDYELWCRIAAGHVATTCERDLVRIRLSDDSLTGRSGRVHMPGSRRVAVEQMRRIVVASGADPSWVDEAFRASAFALLWRPGEATGKENPVSIAAGLFRLHEAFCRAYELPPSTARSHGQSVRARLVGNLLQLARARLRARDVPGCLRFLAGVAASYRRPLRRR